jgi:hypothetical protein
LGIGAALSFIGLQLMSLRTALKEFFMADERWRLTASLVLCFMVMEAISTGLLSSSCACGVPRTLRRPWKN